MSSLLARVAHHEAAHAVVAEALGAPVHLATIVPTPGHRAWVEYGAASAEVTILVAYAGPIAAARHAGRLLRYTAGGVGRRSAAMLYFGASNDLSAAATAAGLGSPRTDGSERRAYLRWLWERARVLVDARWHEVAALAVEFLARGTMDGAEVRSAIRRARQAWKLTGGIQTKKGPARDGRTRRALAVRRRAGEPRHSNLRSW
ncbi:MAG: hypothetical protein QM767_08335 [Anaeromyxobacter sp.]